MRRCLVDVLLSVCLCGLLFSRQLEQNWCYTAYNFPSRKEKLLVAENMVFGEQTAAHESRAYVNRGSIALRPSSQSP